MPLHHFAYSVPMSQFEAEITFLISSFSHLGMKEFLRPVPGVVGLGDTDRPWLWIAGLKDRKPIEDGTEVGVVHVALGAADREQVDLFHSAALKAGGKDNGAPGFREEYMPNYYAAFVISPGGHNIECVCNAAASK